MVTRRELVFQTKTKHTPEGNQKNLPAERLHAFQLEVAGDKWAQGEVVLLGAQLFRTVTSSG